MKNFQHKVRRFREFFTTKGSLNLLSYLPFPSSNTKKDKSLSKLPRCSPHLAGPLKPSATLTSILRGLSSAPAPLFLNNLYPSLFIEMKALNLEIHHGISSRLRRYLLIRSGIHPHVYALEKSRIFVSFRRKNVERKEILFLGSSRQGGKKNGAEQGK